MPTLFSKWNGKALKPASHSPYGQGISSTDLSPGSEDATQLSSVPDLRQIPSSPTYLHKNGPLTGNGADSTTWGPASLHHQLSSVNEFGGSHASQRASQNGRSQTAHARYRTEPQMLSPTSPPTTRSTNIKRPSTGEAAATLTQPPVYGYTTVGWDAQMDVAKAVEVVLACSEQIRARGLDSPLLFSSMALDLSAHNVRSLIQSYLKSPSQFFSSDVKFANPHDLAAVLKWSLARLGRVFPVPVRAHEPSRKGEPVAEESVFVHQRGFLDMSVYARWAAYERKNEYPASAFGSFLDNLSSAPLALLVALFSLLSSTSSYSLKNGMSPSRLARLFGAHLFGLPEDETFERTYDAYVKASNATEHLLLSYIRESGTVETLPIRLADHVRGYPAMLSVDSAKPNRSVRGVPVTHVSRAVRLYSLDLLQTACEMDLAEVSSEWKACCADSDAIGKDPQLSDRYRKLINLRGGSRQGRNRSTARETVDVEHYASLVDKQWGDFMNEGFSAPDESKLIFDLRESERKARSQRPDPVHWSQFEKSGFVVADDGLASVLSFDDGLREDMQRWPAERAELMEKLRKANKITPEFPYDTTPVVVSSPSQDRNSEGQWDRMPVSRFDDVFAEVFADMLMGNGWSNRDEQTHRNANFAVVQYKSRPTQSTVGSQRTGSSNQTQAAHADEPDDRVDAAWFIVEEIVPQQYRSDLEAAGRLKNRSRPSLRKLNIFKRRKEEAGGASNRAGAGRSSFDDVFRPGAGGVTKRLQLSKDPASYSPVLERKSSVSTIRQGQLGEVEETGNGAGLRLMTTLRSKTIKMKRRGRDDDEPPPTPPPKNGDFPPSQSFTSADFDTKSLHDPEMDEFSPADSHRRGFLKATRSTRRESKDDSWLDVMIRANGFRMAGQDAELRRPEQGVDAEERDDRAITPTADDPVLPAVAPVKRKAVQGSKTEPIPQDTLQVAGWTREESSPALTPPKREASLPKIGSERVVYDDASTRSPGLEAPAPQAKDNAGQKSPVTQQPSEEDSPAKLAYLRPLPPRSSTPSEMDEREKARDARIQAAKDRAKELRAGLNPVSVQQLESRKESAKVAPVLLTPTKSAESATPRTPSPKSSTVSAERKSLSPKDDPFAKDRFSGRVASVASKFGGAGAKQLTPQSTGNSLQPSSPATSPSSISVAPAVATQKYPPSLPAEASTMDPNEPVVRKSSESSNAVGADSDSIYPDDAASNFSRDTNPEEDRLASASLRVGGSIAAATAAAEQSSSVPDKARREDEDKPTAMPPGFRVPYQPGMPLSNLEEESESVVSGSNNAA